MMLRVPLVFGYGSLVSAARPRPAMLPGWTRTWGVAMDNSVDLPRYKHYERGGGVRPDVMVAFLDVEPSADGELNGGLVEAADLEALDARERNYDRREVETSEGPAWTYVGSAPGRDRLARGVAEGRCVVQRAYLMRVLSGFAALGGTDALDRFEQTTAPLPGPLEDLVLVPHD